MHLYLKKGVTVVDDNTDVNPNARYSIILVEALRYLEKLKLNVDKDGLSARLKLKYLRLKTRADIDLKGLKTKL